MLSTATRFSNNFPPAPGVWLMSWPQSFTIWIHYLRNSLFDTKYFQQIFLQGGRKFLQWAHVKSHFTSLIALKSNLFFNFSTKSRCYRITFWKILFLQIASYSLLFDCFSFSWLTFPVVPLPTFVCLSGRFTVNIFLTPSKLCPFPLMPNLSQTLFAFTEINSLHALISAFFSNLIL